jgi:signal transduction histidine kinase
MNNDLLQSLIRGLMIPFQEWEERKFEPVTITVDGKEKLFAKDIVDITQKFVGEETKYLSGHVILLTDVTEFSEKEKAKTAFMSTLSHELKTPVAAIEMGTQLLRNHKLGQLSEEQEEWLKIIDENNRRIKKSINEVLDLAQIERGLIELTKSPVNPELTIAQVVKAIEPFTREKNLEVHVKIDRPLPDVIVDPHKVVWVLNNILINAIRYTPEYKNLLVRAVKVDNHRLRISVKDEGPGISPKDQKLVFEPFKRITGDQTEGLGLGLAISKEFIEAMHGRIGVDSREGEGAEFWIELPTIS